MFQDHLLFIYNALGKNETELIEYTRTLYNNFQGTEEDYVNVINLKKELLARSITGTVDWKLDATFVNHMLNEAEGAFSQHSVLEHHKLWLLDAEGDQVTKERAQTWK